MQERINKASTSLILALSQARGLLCDSPSRYGCSEMQGVANHDQKTPPDWGPPAGLSGGPGDRAHSGGRISRQGWLIFERRPRRGVLLVKRGRTGELRLVTAASQRDQTVQSSLVAGCSSSSVIPVPPRKLVRQLFPRLHHRLTPSSQHQSSTCIAVACSCSATLKHTTLVPDHLFSLVPFSNGVQAHHSRH